jgi:hypothetical protein
MPSKVTSIGLKDLEGYRVHVEVQVVQGGMEQNPGYAEAAS